MSALSAVFSLDTLCLIGVLVTAVYCTFAEKPLSSVIALSITGAFMSLEFVMLHAADVAISEAAVGVGLQTVLYIVAIKLTTKKGDEEK